MTPPLSPYICKFWVLFNFHGPLITGLKNRTKVLNREENIWEQAHLGLQHSEIQVEVQTGVGTLFKFLDILETEGGLHTFHLKVSGLMLKLGWGHQTIFKYVREAGRGTLHISIEGIWSDVQTRMGTPHKILRMKKLCCWVGWGGWSEADDNAMLWLHLAIQDGAECANNVIKYSCWGMAAENNTLQFTVNKSYRCSRKKKRLNFDNKLQGENEMFSLSIYFYIHLSIYLFTLFIHLVISRMNRFLYRISEEWFSRMDSQLKELFCEFHRFPACRKSFFS